MIRILHVFVCVHVDMLLHSYMHLCISMWMSSMYIVVIFPWDQKLYDLMLRLLYLQDWLDIDFGIAEGVDFVAISFVKSAEVINHLKSYIAARSRDR